MDHAKSDINWLEAFIKGRGAEIFSYLVLTPSCKNLSKIPRHLLQLLGIGNLK